MEKITIYHNPNCCTSRKVLAAIREHGTAPEVIEYLKTPLDRAALKALIARLGISPREMLRQKEARYGELGLDDPKWTDDEIVGFMAQHPILVQRPIVVTPGAARICRPAETVQELLRGFPPARE